MKKLEPKDVARLTPILEKQVAVFKEMGDVKYHEIIELHRRFPKRYEEVAHLYWHAGWDKDGLPEHSDDIREAIDFYLYMRQGIE